METVVKIRSNLADKIMQGLGLALMVGVSLYLIIGWSSFPDKVPMHYGAAGEIDRWGGKGEILFLVVLWWIMYLVISAVERFPQIWNTGVKGDGCKSGQVYRTLKYATVVSLKLIVTADFAYMIVNITLCRPLGGWFTPVFLVLVFEIWPLDHIAGAVPVMCERDVHLQKCTSPHFPYPLKIFCGF